MGALFDPFTPIGGNERQNALRGRRLRRAMSEMEFASGMEKGNTNKFQHLKKSVQKSFGVRAGDGEGVDVAKCWCVRTQQHSYIPSHPRQPFHTHTLFSTRSVSV